MGVGEGGNDWDNGLCGFCNSIGNCKFLFIMITYVQFDYFYTFRKKIQAVADIGVDHVRWVIMPNV